MCLIKFLNFSTKQMKKIIYQIQTSMAITRSDATNGRYRNHTAFNGSFAQSYDLGKRTIKLRKDGQATAVDDLTAKM
jgi:hypothetical protein